MTTLARLIRILPSVSFPETPGTFLEQEVLGITADSRCVKPGYVFVALRGEQADGHDFIGQAVAGGCLAVVAERRPETLPPDGVSLFLVPDSQEALGLLAAAFYDFPAAGLTLIGLTGTNGKTTTSWLIEAMLQEAGKRIGVIGTVNYRYTDAGGRPVVEDAGLTTPDPVRLQRLLREMADAGASHVIMEVSSHGLVRKRLAGLMFDVAVFTNLSRDHLDFHHTMEDYFAAKQLLFERYLKPESPAVVVIGGQEQEEDWGRRLADRLAGRPVLRCGLAADALVTAGKVRQDIDGLVAELVLPGSTCGLRSSLTGRYNLLNLLTAAGVGHALGIDAGTICRGLARVGRVPGRLERVRLPGRARGPAVFVDYAHTPDALANVLTAMAGLTRGRLVCVFGCGGDRDRGKRPLMGEAVARRADVAIITSDNPRREEPAAIIADILPGLRAGGMEERPPEALFCPRSPARGFLVVEDRQEAIRRACSWAAADDVVVIAGKGHETCQDRGREKIFFDDRLQAADGLLSWNLRHLLAATGGEQLQGDCALLSGRVVTDTRKIEEGDIFVALHGDRFDGHDFVGAAVEAGAGALIVHRDIRPVVRDIPVIRVRDTQQALGDLAAHRRRLLAPALRVAAITGSSGKTTVKEMTAAIFTAHAEARAEAADTVLRTEGNFNNLIGLPLTLLRLRARHRVAVVEMGMNRPGEIERLAVIADPDIGCITNVQPAHLEGLGTIEGVAAAKGELFATMREDAVCVVNRDDPQVRRLAAGRGGRQVGFAVTPAGRRFRPEVRVTRILARGEEGMRFTLHVGEQRFRLTVAAPGEHNVSNCAAAAAIAHAAGIDARTIVRGLERFRAIDRRMQQMRLAGGLQVVNDAYNANPSSMAAALRTVAGFGRRCRRVAVLGDMLELGDETVVAHRRIGRLVAELGYDLLAVTGARAEDVAVAARAAGMARETVRVFSDTEGIADWLYMLLVSGELVGGDWLLVKGSRGMRMERVIEGLVHRFDAGIGEE